MSYHPGNGAAAVAILCLNHRFTGVPPHQARRRYTSGFDATFVA
jgi:hypothetical protein